jgi:hypothetical protein
MSVDAAVGIVQKHQDCSNNSGLVLPRIVQCHAHWSVTQVQSEWHIRPLPWPRRSIRLPQCLQMIGRFSEFADSPVTELAALALAKLMIPNPDLLTFGMQQMVCQPLHTSATGPLLLAMGPLHNCPRHLPSQHKLGLTW